MNICSNLEKNQQSLFREILVIEGRGIDIVRERQLPRVNWAIIRGIRLYLEPEPFSGILSSFIFLDEWFDYDSS